MRILSVPRVLCYQRDHRRTVHEDVVLEETSTQAVAVAVTVAAVIYPFRVARISPYVNVSRAGLPRRESRLVDCSQGSSTNLSYSLDPWSSFQTTYKLQDKLREMFICGDTGCLPKEGNFT